MINQKFFFKIIANTGSLICIIFLIQLFFSVSFGQIQTAGIIIRVIDPNGAVVPNATVEIKKIGSGAPPITVTANADGEAQVNGLEPGSYTATVSSFGFKTREPVKFDIVLGAVKSIDISLVTASASSNVDVSAGKEEDLSNIPNFNNDLSPFLQNTVGAIATGSSALGKIIIDGKGKETVVIRLDGLDATPQVDLPFADQPIDVVDSFQKPTVAFNPAGTQGKATGTFGPATGPGPSVVFENQTLRGGENWFGRIYFDHINDAFNARNFFDYFGKNEIRRGRFGGHAGGRIGKNSDIFFAYEGFRGRTERNFFEAVPLEAICRCGVNGPLAALLGNYLPANTVVMPNRSLTPGFEVVRRRSPITVKANSDNIRLDQPFGSTILRLRNTIQSSTAFVPDGVTGRQQRQKLLLNNFFASLEVPGANTPHFFSFGINSTRVRVNSENPVALSPELTQSSVNLSGAILTKGLPGIVSVPVASIGTLIKGTGRGFDLDPKVYSLSYNSTISVGGNHVLSFGVESRFIRLNFDRLGGITRSFSNLTAFRAGLPSSTNFLSDLSGLNPFNDLIGKRHVEQNYFLSYVQVASVLLPGRLTLTYGVRHDYFGGVSERDNRVFLLDPETGTVLAGDARFFRAKANNFQPRISAAFMPETDGIFENTLIKAGIGVYSGSPKVADLMLPVESDRLNTTIIGGSFTDNIATALNDFRTQPLTRQFQPLTFSRNFAIPEKLYKWDASMTQTVAKVYEMTLQYSGNAGRNLPIARVGNQIVSVATNPDPTLPALVVRQFDRLSNGQILKPYGELFYRTSEGRSNFNSISGSFKQNQVVNEKIPSWIRFAYLLITYTYGLNKGNANGSVVSNSQNIDADYGFNSSDIRHSFGVTATYDLWMAFKDPKKKDSPLWGWEINSIFSARSGSPLLVRIDRPDVVYVDGSGNFFSSPAAGRSAVLNIPGGGSAGGTLAPNIIPGVNPYSNANRLTLLNPQAFAIPQPGSFGNFRRGQVRGPGNINLDLSLTRYLFKKEHFISELKVDVYNVFNRANFANPIVSLPGMDAASNQIQPGTPFGPLSAGSFGIVSAAELGRRIQFSIVLKFNRDKIE